MCHERRENCLRACIVIDGKLMPDTLRAMGLKTKREAVEDALEHSSALAASRSFVASERNWRGRATRTP
jgi:Arc/MetJ family transcription regulator